MLHVWLSLHISVVIPLFASPQSITELAMVRMSALRVPLAPSTSRREAVQYRATPASLLFRLGDTSPVESWISAASPTFPPFLKTSRLLWTQGWADAIRAEALKTTCWWSSSGSATDWLVPAAEVTQQDRQQGTAGFEGKDLDRVEKGAGIPSRIKGCCHKSLSVTQWDHLSICRRFP